jgi:hypothetical protein
MATKNLARTVIEGGRTSWNQWIRRHSHGRARAREREIEARLPYQTDFDDLVIPGRAQVWRSFDDKLGPTRRWLTSQIGRPWKLVHSELFERFDTRTTPGRHIVFDHMLPSVRQHGHCERGRARFIVDAHGILRGVPRERWRHRQPEPLPRLPVPPCDWLANRRVGVRGAALFWFTATPAGAFRQAGRLSDDDCAIWRALPEWFRKQHDPAAPLHTIRN